MSTLPWKTLSSPADLESAHEASFSSPVVLYKHSTRCSISSMAMMRLEREYSPTPLQFYYLDLIQYRAVSNAIAEKYKVYHESPQVLLLVNGECVYDASHMEINFAELISEADTHAVL
ncbi:MAG: bacillithiol system redox-active protein YtxJ [Bacteroidetes bacterium]|nr:MAG: bacillithiol system redox-active protein YtxJ [Bacteroidota bacterium]